jgi:hypothetical protein
MRTKTLLIAAAALAATVTASQAQTVYSQNVVGYINITVTNQTLVFAANQLDTGSNTLDNVFNSGVQSGFTKILEWNGAGYNTYTYENSSLSGVGSGWFKGSVHVGLTNYVQPGYSFFIDNLGSAPITIPTVGQVTQGTNIYVISPGLTPVSLPEPLAGVALNNTNVNFPVVSGYVKYLTWNGGGYTTYTYENSSLSGVGSGFFNGPTPIPTSALPPAGGGFFVDNLTVPPTTLYWTNVFEVQ